LSALTAQNFNLLSMKEALTVERLTEVTLLLAEVTILFMPVSLLAAYFSCQFADTEFRVATFWKWFAGVFASSVLTLVGFSFVAGTKEGKIITKPLTRRLMESTPVLFGRRRRRGAGAERVDDTR
jgi:heme/copper-type cytochrome/quinol oxidase subunit 2